MINQWKYRAAGMLLPALLSCLPSYAADPSLPALKADIQTQQTTYLSNGNKLNKTITTQFYRDASGRTRIEQGDTVVINDTVAHTVTVLGISEHVATVTQTTQETIRKTVSSPSSTDSIPPAQLGALTINGWNTVGRETTTTIPAHSSLGNDQAIVKTTRVWSSDELKVPLRVTVDDPVTGTFQSEYQNIVTNPPLEPSLFQIPSGFKIVKQAPLPAGVQGVTFAPPQK